MSDELTPFDYQVRTHLYRGLAATGEAPSVAATASALAATGDEVTAALLTLERNHLVALAPTTTHVWMAHPFSAVQSPFRVDAADGRSWWANCAWDAFSIPPLVGTDAETQVPCPSTHQLLTIRVSGGELMSLDAVVHFAVPPRRFWENIAFT